MIQLVEIRGRCLTDEGDKNVLCTYMKLPKNQLRIMENNERRFLSWISGFLSYVHSHTLYTQSHTSFINTYAYVDTHTEKLKISRVFPQTLKLI